MRNREEMARHRQVAIANDVPPTEIFPAGDDETESDPFLKRMFARMTPGARHLFTPYQLDEIKRAFSARSFGTHAVDLRFSFQLLRQSYYVVFLLGRERRTNARINFHLPPSALLACLVALGAIIFYVSR